MLPKCPICKSKERTEFFIRINKYSYFLCNNCITLFLNPLPSDKEIDFYYKYKFTYNHNIINEKRTIKQANKIIKNLIKLNPYGKKLLDVGSGLGLFLNEAKKYNLEVLGIEPSKNLYNLSIKKIPGLNLKNETFYNFFNKNKNIKFDFITLIHVIEHLNNPINTIKQVINLLKKNGILYIETPNLNSHLFYTEKNNYTFLTPPEHLWIFSLKSIKRILINNDKVNFVRISTYSYPEHFMGIIKKIIKKQTNHDRLINSKIKKTIYFIDDNNKTLGKNLKYLVIDKFLAYIFTPLLNIGKLGSILELYIKKK